MNFWLSTPKGAVGSNTRDWSKGRNFLSNSRY